MMTRFVNGFVFLSHDGLSVHDTEKIREDLDNAVQYGGLDKNASHAQVESWTAGDVRLEQLLGDGYTVLEFRTNGIREAVNAERWYNLVGDYSEEEWNLPLSTAISRLHDRSLKTAAAENNARKRAVEEYQTLTSEEWITRKNFLQRLIAAGEGWRLNPENPEAAGYEAMFGLMARAVWNAARWDSGKRLCIPSAKEISTEAEKIIRRWELRRMI